LIEKLPFSHQESLGGGFGCGVPAGAAAPAPVTAAAEAAMGELALKFPKWSCPCCM